MLQAFYRSPFILTPGSESALGIRIRIQVLKIDKIIKKIITSEDNLQFHYRIITITAHWLAETTNEFAQLLQRKR